MHRVTLTADYPAWANEDTEDAIFEENAQRFAQALVDRGYTDVSVKVDRGTVALSQEPPPPPPPDESKTKKD